MRATDIFRPGPSNSTSEVIDLEHPDAPAAVERSSATQPGPDGRWETTSVRAGEKPRRAGYRILENGAVALEWSRSVKDTDPHGPTRLYRFDPPLVMAPPELRTGELFEHRTSMTEREPDDETRVALSGKASQEIRLVGPEHPDWPAQFPDANAAAAISRMRIRVGPATARRDTWTVILPPERRGEQIVDYSIRVLGLRFKHERHRFVPRFDHATTATGEPGTD